MVEKFQNVIKLLEKDQRKRPMVLEKNQSLKNKNCSEFICESKENPNSILLISKLVPTTTAFCIKGRINNGNGLLNQGNDQQLDKT